MENDIVHSKYETDEILFSNIDEYDLRIQELQNKAFKIKKNCNLNIYEKDAELKTIENEINYYKSKINEFDNMIWSVDWVCSK